MKVSGRAGRLRLRLEPAEIVLLRTLFGELVDVIDADPAADEAAARLFPTGYRDDEDAATEFRTLTENTLRDERRSRIGACEAELAGEVALGDPDVARRWIQTLNDLRLTSGTRLGVSEDDDTRAFDPTDPDQRDRLVYYWLSATQDAIVSRLMR